MNKFACISAGSLYFGVCDVIITPRIASKQINFAEGNVLTRFTTSVSSFTS